MDESNFQQKVENQVVAVSSLENNGLPLSDFFDEIYGSKELLSLRHKHTFDFYGWYNLDSIKVDPWRAIHFSHTKPNRIYAVDFYNQVVKYSRGRYQCENPVILYRHTSNVVQLVVSLSDKYCAIIDEHNCVVIIKNQAPVTPVLRYALSSSVDSFIKYVKYAYFDPQERFLIIQKNYFLDVLFLDNEKKNPIDNQKIEQFFKNKSIQSVAFDPTGRYMVVRVEKNNNQIVHVYHVIDFSKQYCYILPNVVNCFYNENGPIACSPDGRYVVEAQAHRLFFYDMKAQTKAKVFLDKEHKNITVQSLRFHPSASMVIVEGRISGWSSRFFMIFDYVKGLVVRKVVTPCSAGIFAQFSDDGHYVFFTQALMLYSYYKYKPVTLNQIFLEKLIIKWFLCTLRDLDTFQGNDPKETVANCVNRLVQDCFCNQQEVNDALAQFDRYDLPRIYEKILKINNSYKDAVKESWTSCLKNGDIENIKKLDERGIYCEDLLDMVIDSLYKHKEHHSFIAQFIAHHPQLFASDKGYLQESSLAYYLSKYPSEEIGLALLKVGAHLGSIHLEGMHNITSLMVACFYNLPEVVTALLKIEHVELTDQNNYYCDAFYYAEMHADKTCLNLLIKEKEKRQKNDEYLKGTAKKAIKDKKKGGSFYDSIRLYTMGFMCLALIGIIIKKGLFL